MDTLVLGTALAAANRQLFTLRGMQLADPPPSHKAAVPPITPMVLLLVIGLAIVIGAVAFAVAQKDGMAQARYGIIAGMVLIGSSMLVLVFGTARREWRLLPEGLETRSRLWFLPALVAPRLLSYESITGVHPVTVGARPLLRVVTDHGSSREIELPIGAPFAIALIGRVTAARGARPDCSEAHNLWTTMPGLLVIALGFLIAIAIAVAAVWAFIEEGMPLGRRMGQGLGLALALPLLMGWWLRAMLKRRGRIQRVKRGAA